MVPPQPPPDSALDNSFDVSKFTGRWYITAGLNPLFDTFACQDHYFGVPKPGADVAPGCNGGRPSHFEVAYASKPCTALLVFRDLPHVFGTFTRAAIQGMFRAA